MSQDDRGKHPNSLANIAKGRLTDDYKPEYCEMIVEFMKQGYSLGSFGAHIGKTTKTLKEWARKYPEFGEAHALGKQQAFKFYETMLASCAMGIIPEQLKAKGSKKLDISAIIFALKTRFHQEYGERQEIDHKSSDGSFQVNFVKPKDT